MCGDQVISVKLGQYHGCWCSGSLRRQDISSHDTDYIEYLGPYLTWGRILRTCVISMWRNDIECKYMSMFTLKNLARKGLKASMMPAMAASWHMGGMWPKLMELVFHLVRLRTSLSQEPALDWVPCPETTDCSRKLASMLIAFRHNSVCQWTWWRRAGSHDSTSINLLSTSKFE